MAVYTVQFYTLKVKALRKENQSIRQIAKALDLSHGSAQRLVAAS
jgi:transposase